MADPGVKSVLLPKGLGFWMRTYRDIDFGGYSSMLAESSNENWTTCVSFNKFEGSMVSSLKWGKIFTDETPIDSNCCRLYYFPDF